MKKKIITLTTDFGEDSFYEAILKGKLMKALPNAIITSITNKITKFDIRETAFVLRSSYKFFPEGIGAVNTVKGIFEKINDFVAKFAKK